MGNTNGLRAGVVVFLLLFSSAGWLSAQTSATAMVTVGSDTYMFQAGACRVGPDTFSIVAGRMAEGERFELNIPHTLRASSPTADKPTKDGTYTQASLTVIPAGGASTKKNWTAGGRTESEADFTVILKNNRTAGEFSSRTDGSPRRAIKGSFSC